MILEGHGSRAATDTMAANVPQPSEGPAATHTDRLNFELSIVPCRFDGATPTDPSLESIRPREIPLLCAFTPRRVRS